MTYKADSEKKKINLFQPISFISWFSFSLKCELDTEKF